MRTWIIGETHQPSRPPDLRNNYLLLPRVNTHDGWCSNNRHRRYRAAEWPKKRRGNCMHVLRHRNRGFEKAHSVKKVNKPPLALSRRTGKKGSKGSLVVYSCMNKFSLPLAWHRFDFSSTSSHCFLTGHRKEVVPHAPSPRACWTDTIWEKHKHRSPKTCLLVMILQQTLYIRKTYAKKESTTSFVPRIVSPRQQAQYTTQNRALSATNETRTRGFTTKHSRAHTSCNQRKRILSFQTMTGRKVR